jgi:uncharacterized phage protein (TIGR01671 family)
MREIKFRGKIISELVVLNGKWCIGFLSKKGFEMFITTEGVNAIVFKIDPETVGEFTGLHDKNGKGIYEGDRMQIQQGYYKALRNRDIELEVVFNHGSFVLKNDKFETPIDTTGEVIGNIYENPELLKEDK